MKTRSQHARQRQSFILESQDLLFRKVRRAQGLLYSILLDLLFDLDIDADGNLKFTSKNIARVTQVQEKVDGFNTRNGRSLGKWIGRKAVGLFGLNRLYFRRFNRGDFETVDQKVLRLTMQRIGFDAVKGTIVKGGWLAGLTSDQGLALTVGNQITGALAAKTPLKTFQKDFKAVFTGGPESLGVLERHYNTNTFDIFQQQDRLYGLTYADELGLNFAVYSGTLKSNSRPFCIERVGKVFTREQIAAWKDLEFQGKNRGYNPFTDLGGHNCRHSLDWVSDEVAKTLLKRNNQAVPA